MKTLDRGATRVEVLVMVAIVVIVVALLITIVLRGLRDAREVNQRSTCEDNLARIVKACITYQQSNGDFFPAFAQSTWAGSPANTVIPPAGHAGCDGTFQPMPSLACLYPAYIDNVKIFGCPATNDQPLIARRSRNGTVHACFGFDVDPGRTGKVTNWTDPASFTGSELGTKYKCSYFYDELTNFRKIGPGQAVACDADGQTWLKPYGAKPDYPKNWTRRPKAPNHERGQFVMYFDGNVKWMGSVDPKDNIFCPHAVGDGYLWDGVNARQPEP